MEQAIAERLVGVVTIGAVALAVGSVFALSEVYEIENVTVVGLTPAVLIVLFGIGVILYAHYYLA